MPVQEEHKALLKGLGLTEKDFDLFDGKHVQYEYDEEKGVRLYDPYYNTSYNEYIGIDGWSSWSSENDTFMHDILRGVQEKVEQGMAHSPRQNDQDVAEALQKKFGKPAQEKA